MIRILLIVVTCVSPIFCLAEISLNSIFSDGAVLQREIPLKFWGNGKPGETVVVSFEEDQRTTTVKRDTKWSVTFDSKSASITPKTLQVEGEGETIVISDLLVGDVWICSGQSNMGFKLAKCDGGETDIAGASDHLLRVNNYRGTWEPCVSEVAAETSGVAYYFGRRLREKDKDIPVGLIVRALSGTPIEAWTPFEDLREIDFAREMLKRFDASGDEGRQWLAYAKAEADWKQVSRKDGRKAAGKKPQYPGDSEAAVLAEIYCTGNPGRLWRERITPLVGYSLAGVIWYQGERNTKAGKVAASAYEDLVVALIESWRRAWEQGNFRFLVVQLPTFSKGGPNWTIVQQGQAAAVGRLANADYVAITDLPDGGLHPPNKRPVGERLADKAEP